jgi:sugar phosphate isomerase/epimerase
MIWSLIKDRNPAVMGAYLDAGHMFTEGRYGVWRIGLDLLSDRLFMVAVKDMTWGLPESGQSTPRQHPQVVPVGQGDVRWADFFRHLRIAGFYGPISIHSEYSSMDAAEIVKQTAQDLQYFRQVFDKVESV